MFRQPLTKFTEEYDFDIFRKYMVFFPSTSLSKLVRGYFNYWDIPLSTDEDEDGSKHEDTDDDDSDSLDTILVRF